MEITKSILNVGVTSNNTTILKPIQYFYGETNSVGILADFGTEPADISVWNKINIELYNYFNKLFSNHNLKCYFEFPTIIYNPVVNTFSKNADTGIYGSAIFNDSDDHIVIKLQFSFGSDFSEQLPEDHYYLALVFQKVQIK